MIAGLHRCDRLEVTYGADGKLFAALRTVLTRRPHVIHYDWMYRYWMRRYRWWTWLHAPIFLAEVYVVRYLLGCRIVWTLHNLGTHDVAPSQLERWVRRRFARVCDWIRVFQPSTVDRAAAYLDIDRARFRVIPEGSYVGYYPNGTSRSDARQRLRVEMNAFLLLYLGGVRPYKGLEELIEAFKEMSLPSWTLVVAGRPLNAAYANELRKACEGVENIRLELRFIPDEEVQYYFAACDAVALPFKCIENSGSAILAMGFAKPIVAPAQGVLPDRLRQQSTLLYRDGELRQVLESLKSYDRDELLVIGKRNFEAVQQHSWDDFARAFTLENRDHPVEA